MSTAFLLVTCCLERSRSEILAKVIANLQEQAPELSSTLTVFDNASSEVGTIDVLCDCFNNVYRSDRNVGYWSAVDWWLEHLSDDPPTFTYIIESDLIHYNFDRLKLCEEFLKTHDDVGSVRLHEYSVSKRHLYDKDRPRNDSIRGLWQSHTNKVTGKPISFEQSTDDIWSTTFLTQLPALNRYQTMKEVFDSLRHMQQFTEIDFQRLYWQRYAKTAILDGGIFHANLSAYDLRDVITGSWTNEVELRRLGYQTTRVANIMSKDQYTVTRA